MPKRLRTKKVFIDWSQNSDYKTTVSVYSLRAKTYRPYVSLPVHWDELSNALKKKDADALLFTPVEAIERVRKLGDLFKPVLSKVQKFPAELRRYFERQRVHPAQRSDALETYAAKRDFRKTAEPKPAMPRRSDQGSRRRFVIQKHDATRLHYDLRLEMAGAYKSWAVPKGLPFSKGEKRLAVQVEDHPLAYGGFEGTIPHGQYGGGTVMLWDRGTYTPLTNAPAKDLKSGKLHFTLKGEKLNGEWYLVRLREGDQWLVIKGGEDMKPLSSKRDDSSVLSGRSMKQLAKAEAPAPPAFRQARPATATRG